MLGDNILTAISVAKECQMVPKSHQVVVIRASTSECGDYTLSYYQLNNGSGSAFDIQDMNDGELRTI